MKLHTKWFAHVERMDNDSWVEKCRDIVVDLGCCAG